MRNLDFFARHETSGAPDRVKSWSVRYPYSDGDYSLPRPPLPGPPAWLGTGPYCNYAHGCLRDRFYGRDYGQPKRLTDPRFSEPPRLGDTP